MNLFYFCISVYTSLFVRVSMSMCGYLDISVTHIGLCPQEKGLKSLEVAPKD